MKRKFIFGFFSLLFPIFLLVIFQNFSTPKSTEDYLTSSNKTLSYDQAKARFRGLRNARVSKQYSEPWPAIGGAPFWGMLNKNIAAVWLDQAFDNAAALSGLDQEIKGCAASKDDLLWEYGCYNLQWPLLVRLYVLSSQKPAGAKSKMSAEVEKRILDHLFYLLDRSSEEAARTKDGVWKNSAESENHSFTKQSTYFLAAQILAGIPTYNSRKLSNGLTPEQMYVRWRDHWNYLLDERVKYGLLMEVGSHTYHKYTLASILNLVDLSANPAIRLKAKNLLDLVFATAAVESLRNGARGGSQSRKGVADYLAGASPSTYFLAYLTDLGPTNLMVHSMSLPTFTSDYFPAEVVWKIWNNDDRKLPYEATGRLPGVKAAAAVPISMDVDPSRAVFRTTYVTPNYVLGSNLIDLNRNYYSTNGAEGRSISLYINEGNLDGNFRDIPQVLFSPGSRSCFDKAVAVQKRNAMVYQNSIDFFLHGGREVQDKGTESCYGLTVVTGATREIKSERVFAGVKVPLNFIQGEKHFFQDEEITVDATRNTFDMTFTKTFEVDESNLERGIFLASPGGSTYIWVKPVVGTFNQSLEGYNPEYNGGSRTPNYPVRDVVLKDDKFSPVVVVVSDAANYGHSFLAFKREIERTSGIRYANNSVLFRPSLRSSLGVEDLFIDSSDIGQAGDWKSVADDSAHNGELFKATKVGAPFRASFNVPVDGTYYIKARVRGRTIQSNSFDISFDGGSKVNWAIGDGDQLRWLNAPLFNGSNKIKLLAGNHTIDVYARNLGAEFDAFALVKNDDDREVEIVFQENYNRHQELSAINGVKIDQSPVHGKFTYKSPFVRSERDSGVWQLSYGAQTMIIDHSSAVPKRAEGILVQAEKADGIARDAVKKDGLTDSRYVEMSSVNELNYHIQVPADGAYTIFARTRASDGGSDSFYVTANGGSFKVWKIPQIKAWTWNEALEQKSDGSFGEKIVLSLKKGPNTITLKKREAAELDSFVIVGP